MAKLDNRITRMRAKHAKNAAQADTPAARIAEEVRFLRSAITVVPITDPITVPELRRIVRDATEDILRLAAKAGGAR